MTAPTAIAPYTGPVCVTLAYLLIYYTTQLNILRVKDRKKKEFADKGEKFDRYFGQDRELLAADRIQLNMLEHMPPFLALLWLNAVFVAGWGTTIAGGVYVMSRLGYPLALGTRVGRGPRTIILLATGPGYAVLIYLTGALIWTMLA